ncbi:MAG: hypothetical protein KF813_11870 [Trueperaceae bacterium]|nr:hypothetical protein [Trueperaceae bacterium]
MNKLVVVGCAFLLLSGCRLASLDHNDRVRVSHPVVTVSDTEIDVDGFVEVTIRVTVSHDSRSRARLRSAYVEFGTCLIPDWSGVVDNCDPSSLRTDADFEPSADFVLAPGDEASLRSHVALAPGELTSLEHTFSLTSRRAGTVQLIGAFFSYDPAQIPGDGYCVEWECAVVTWN